MSSVKTRLLQMLETIDDEAILKTLMDDLIFYTTQKDVLDILQQDRTEENEEEMEKDNDINES
ncbi:MAG: hypothetical protein ACTHJ5_12280 [Ilyomonas sp.]